MKRIGWIGTRVSSHPTSVWIMGGGGFGYSFGNRVIETSTKFSIQYTAYALTSWLVIL